MKKTILIIILSILFLGGVFYLTLNKTKSHIYYNEVTLSENNLVANSTEHLYYDTVLSVAMDMMEIVNGVVIVKKLPQSLKGTNGEEQLLAHVRYVDSVFYLFIDDLSRDECIEVISHEVIHMDQYLSRDLVYDNGVVFWKGETFVLDNTPYGFRPWEADAFNRQKNLSDAVHRVLWN